MPNRILFPLYGLVLCLMNIFAIGRYEKTTPNSFNFVVLGAVLFGISDNLLAFLKFNKIYSDLGRGAVMLFYYSGQYFLMHGAIHHSNLQHEIGKFFKSNSGVGSLTIGKNTPSWDQGHKDGNVDLPVNLNIKTK